MIEAKADTCNTVIFVRIAGEHKILGGHTSDICYTDSSLLSEKNENFRKWWAEQAGYKFGFVQKIKRP